MNNRLFGMKVIVTDIGTHEPKIQVSPGFRWITEEARRDMNMWLKNRFGTACCALQMTNPLGEQVIIICPHVEAKLKAERGRKWQSKSGK